MSNPPARTRASATHLPDGDTVLRLDEKGRLELDHGRWFRRLALCGGVRVAGGGCCAAAGRQSEHRSDPCCVARRDLTRPERFRLWCDKYLMFDGDFPPPPQ